MNYITLDFETTGLNIMRDLPVQAAIQVNDDTGRETLSEDMILNPEIPISKAASNVHGISQRTAQIQGKSLVWFANHWHRVVWDHQPAVLLGYNIINYDLPILMRVLHRHKTGKFKFPPLERVTDVMFLAQRFFQTKKWPRLMESVNRLGIPHKAEDFHDARADVRYTHLVYRKLIGRD